MNITKLTVSSSSSDNVIGDKEEMMMNKMIKDGYSAEELKISKKGNMMYWDNIDAVSEDYVKQIIEFSIKGIKIPELMTEDDVLLEVSKEVTECVVNYLEKHFGAEFPVVDENY